MSKRLSLLLAGLLVTSVAGVWVAPSTWAGSSVYRLDVSKNIHIGHVTSSPTGINCGGDCAEDFGSGTQITLSRTVEVPGYEFDEWGGACAHAGTAQQCVITMDAAKAVSATWTKTDFTPPTITMTGGPANGSVTSDRDVAFTFTAQDASGIATWPECKLDGEPVLWHWCSDHDWPEYGHAATDLGLGAHRLRVRIRDYASNYGYATVGWTIKNSTLLSTEITTTATQVKASGVLLNDEDVDQSPVAGAPVTVNLFKLVAGKYKFLERRLRTTGSAGRYTARFERRKGTRCKVTARYAGDGGHRPSSAVEIFDC